MAVDLAAYRIIQESLTNAQKHGDGRPTRLRVEYGENGVALLIENSTSAETTPKTTPTPTSSGYGLIGMRERAIAVGGTLTADHTPEGRFAVRAFLPATRHQEINR